MDSRRKPAALTHGSQVSSGSAIKQSVTHSDLQIHRGSPLLWLFSYRNLGGGTELWNYGCSLQSGKTSQIKWARDWTWPYWVTLYERRMWYVPKYHVLQQLYNSKIWQVEILYMEDLHTQTNFETLWGCGKKMTTPVSYKIIVLI